MHDLILTYGMILASMIGDIAFNTLHVYPRLEGVTKDNYLERRGEAAMVVMKDFREQCLDEPELKPEVTSTSR